MSITFPFQTGAGSEDERPPGTMYRDENDDIWVVLADSSVVQVGGGGSLAVVTKTMRYTDIVSDSDAGAGNGMFVIANVMPGQTAGLIAWWVTETFDDSGEMVDVNIAAPSGFPSMGSGLDFTALTTDPAGNSGGQQELGGNFGAALTAIAAPTQLVAIVFGWNNDGTQGTVTFKYVVV